MSQADFHTAYQATPEHFKAELIGGVVYVASPLRLRHGTNHLPLGSLLSELMRVLSQGMSTPEYVDFARKLSAAKSRS